MGWSPGFYPGLEPGAQRFGSAATFEMPAEACERAWQQLEPTLTEDDYEH
jgi:hypothetical protein